MPNETQDLIFNLKANTSNAEQGMGKIGKLTDDLKITTEKTSGALREFGGQLKQARDLSDVAGMATKALGQVLGASLGGTAVLVAGKALIDAFNTVQTAVKETEEKTKAAFKEIEKAGLPRTFEESAMQADKLSASADAVSKKIQEIESNPLQKFIAGITGAKDKMDELVISTQKAAQERIKLGVQTAVADEEFQRGLSDKEKALNTLFKSYQEKADKIAASMMAAGADPAEIKKITAMIYDAHTVARLKMLNDYALKEETIAQDNATKISDMRRANDMAEFELKQKSDNVLFENERARLNENMEARRKADEDEAKRREESAKRLEEYQNKYVQLTEKRVALEEKIATINDQIVAKQGELAQQAAGAGGTMRGPGQAPTSYEIGFKRSVSQATSAQQRIEAEKSRNQLQDKLVSQMSNLQGVKYDPSKLTKAEKNALVSPERIQILQKAQALEAARNKVIEGGTKSLQVLEEKQNTYTDQLNQNTQSSQMLEEAFWEMKDEVGSAEGAVSDFTEQVQKASGAMGGAGGAAGQPSPVITVLGEIKTFLEKNLTELEKYAHAT